MGIIDSVYPDGVPVQKGNIRSDDKSGHRRNIPSVSDVQSADLTGQYAGIYVRELQASFDLVTGDLSAHNGTTLLVDSSGNRFKIVGDPFNGKRAQVRVATTANITIATALNNGDSIDGVTLATNDLVLVKDQGTKAQNGIYVVGASPARSAEFDTFNEHAGAIVAVAAGTVNTGSVWFCSANLGGTLNTTDIVFTELAATAGPPGADGPEGPAGPPGPATIAIGSVTTLAPGEDATVTNSGDPENVVLDFGIPEGEQGIQGIQGIQGVQGVPGSDGADGSDGDDGWSAVFAVVADSARRVLQVIDWVGGSGTKPATGKYVGATGFETLIANGVDIRGATGAPGAGSGDMQASTYDPNGDGKFANAQLDDMAQGTVKMRRAGASTGAPTDTTLANLKADLGLDNVTNTAQMPLAYLDTDTTLAANSDSKVPSQKAIKAYADALIAANDAMVFKGVIDCSANPNYPAADRGWTYRVSVAGKIGGASGVVVQAGDILICLTDSTASGNQATVGASWTVVQTNIDGALVTTDIGVTVQAYDADTMKSDTTATLTKGFNASEFDAGTKSSGTFTPDPANGNFQKAVNGGAHTLAPPASSCSIVIQYTNNGSAGAITTSGFTKRTGDTITTVNGDDFLMFLTRVNGFTHLHVQALQ